MVSSKGFMSELFPAPKPIIGMVHLRPLPGSPLYDPISMGMSSIIDVAVEEARALEGSGVDGLQIENIWDYPYVKGSDIGHETSAALAAVAARVRDVVSIPIGINCHLNGGKTALAVACAVGAKWIRVFEWANAYVSHAGITEGIGGALARYRSFLKAYDIKFLCDVNVKHGSHFIISDRSIVDQAHDIESQGADALIVTGFETGKAPTKEKVENLACHVSIPLFLGSGTTKENVAELLKHADGAIVGSYFKKDNDWKQSVDPRRVCEFMQAVRGLRGDLRNE